MTFHEHGTWHPKVIPASTEASLCALRDARLLDRFYLAGGTGLALQFGHRLSLDLDFFAKELFDEEMLLQRVQALDGFALVAKAPHTLHATVRETKVSFLGYAYPVLFPTSRFLEVEVADPRDIACMKVSASRAAERGATSWIFTYVRSSTVLRRFSNSSIRSLRRPTTVEFTSSNR